MNRGVRVALAVLAPIAFVGSSTVMLPKAFRIAEPMTHTPIDEFDGPFPILVVSGNEASVVMSETPYEIPLPPAGASYLVPIDRVDEIERYIRAHDTTLGDSAWVLDVKQLSADRQRIELYRMGDGFWGGVYEAMPEAIVPQYRKVAGPGFAFVFGPLSMAMNAALWGLGFLVFLAVRWYRRARSSRAPSAASPVAST